MNVPGSPLIDLSARTERPTLTPALDRANSLQTRRPWVWWHLLSFDAPTVAVVWCWFFAAAFGLSLPWPVLPTLVLGTWSVYVADRLLDGWSSRDTVSLRDRHWFYLRHRRAFGITWLLVAVPLAWLIFFRISPTVRAADVVLCLIGIAYFVLIHKVSSRKCRQSARPERPTIFSCCSHLLTKELAVGFLFPIATVIPAWTRVAADRGLLAVAVIIFGAACWLNCVAIQTWEDAEVSYDVMHTILGAPAAEHSTDRGKNLTQVLGKHLSAFAWIVFAASLALSFIAAKTPLWPVFAAVTMSAALFIGLIRNRRKFSTLSLRIAADAALLTPLLFLLRAL